MSQTTDVLNVQVNVTGDGQYRERMQRCTGSTLAFKAAITGITLATKKFISSALELASNLEEVNNVVEVTFGGMTDAINDFSKSALQNYGLSETIAKKYIGTFGAMSRSFGFIPEQAEKMSIALTAMAGDVASFYNLESDVAYTKLKSVFTGETESLKELGIVMTQTALDQYALEKGMGKTTKQMTEQEKVALRYMFVMEKLKNVSGDYKDTSTGWANSFRTAKLEIQQMVAEVGSALMPAAKVALSYTMQGLKIVLGFLKSTASGLSLVAQGWAASSKSTKVFIGIATGAVLALINFNKIAAVTKVVTGFMSAGIKILNMNLLTTLTVTQALKGALGIIAVIAGAIGAVKLISSISGVFDSLEESMKNQTQTASDMNMEWEDGSEKVKDYTDATKELEKSLMSFDEVNKIGDKSILGDVISDDALDNFGDFKNMLDGMFDNLNIGALGDLGGVFDDAKSKMEGFFNKYGEKIENTKKLWDEMVEHVANEETFNGKFWAVVEGIDGILNEWFPNWTSFWEDAGSTAYDMVFNEPKWRNKVELVEKLIRKHFGGTAWYTLWSGTWGTVLNLWEVVFDILSGDIASLIFDLDNLTSKAQYALNFARATIKGDYGGALEAALNLQFGKSELTGKYNNLPSNSSKSILPASFIGPRKYAAGGFPNTGEMFVARESGPEMVGKIGNKTAVANNEQITTAIYNAVKSAMGGGKGGTTVLYVDGKVLGKATVDYINNQTMSSGQSPLVEIG